mgnify:CR=1 FL=1
MGSGGREGEKSEGWEERAVGSGSGWQEKEGNMVLERGTGRTGVGQVGGRALGKIFDMQL